MALQSKLLRGDPKLEATAISDPAHITIGARGEHVRKIQFALIVLDGAGIASDGAYGSETAAAVLAYKQNRGIINRSYETQADNIVGKMTMASLDREMLERERVPHRPVRIVPRSNWVMGSRRSPTLLTRSSPSLQFALSAAATAAAPRFSLVNLNIGPTELELLPFHTGSIIVEDGAPGTVQVISDPFINAPPIVSLSNGFGPGSRILSVGDKNQIFNVIAGRLPGTAMIVASLMLPDPDAPSAAAIDVTVIGNILNLKTAVATASSPDTLGIFNLR